MARTFLFLFLCASVLSACDWDELTSRSGGGGSDNGEDDSTFATDTTSGSGSGSDGTKTAEPTTTKPPPKKTQPAASKNCGVGRYAFHTDADGKFHFDAVFEKGGVIRYNFSVQPNTGRWRISGDSMTFNGPFGTGASDHTSTWRITSRASDCSVLQFRGKSYGQANVTASRS